MILSANVLVLAEEAKRVSPNFEIILVENGSTDSTPSLMLQLVAQHPFVRGFSLPDAGYGEAIRFGCQQATYDMYIFSIDISMGLDLIANAYALLPTYAVVNGSRYLDPHSVDRPFLRKVMSSLSHRLLGLLVDHPFTDFDGIKALSKEYMMPIVTSLGSKGNFMHTELLLQAASAGLRVIEVPIPHVDNRSSRFSLFSASVNHLSELWYFLRSRSALPVSQQGASHHLHSDQ